LGGGFGVIQFYTDDETGERMNISVSISETIEDPKFLPALSDLAEASIDTLLDEGLIKEIPIILKVD
jgi:hypothetical protein